MQIHEAVNNNGRRHVGLHFVTPELRGLESILDRACDFEQKAASAIAAGENPVADHRRRQNIHSAEGFDVLRPQHFSTLQVDTAKLLASLHNSLSEAGNRGNHWR